MGMLAAALAIGETKPTILVHYMPWFASKPVSGAWGWHWTMDHFDPDRVDKEGRRSVASHDYPMLGAYDSQDPELLECQVQLMKFAGIGGLVINWYGIKDFNDYAAIHQNVRSLVPVLRRAGLKFAVCYEDQTVGHMVKGGVLKADETVDHGRAVMDWLAENWFKDKAYLKRDGVPVLLVFGPQYFSRDQWRAVTARLSGRAALFALPHHAREKDVAGSFAWPPVWGGKQVAKEDWWRELETVYAGGDARTMIRVAFPGFHDIYEQAGVHASYGRIQDRDGATFNESLELALKGGSGLVQIATWNDYGEGTAIEPGRRYGYRYLDALQRRSGGPFDASDLRLPIQLYHLRKDFKGHAEASAALTRASGLLLASEIPEARACIQHWQAATSQGPAAKGKEVPE